MSVDDYRYHAEVRCGPTHHHACACREAYFAERMADLQKAVDFESKMVANEVVKAADLRRQLAAANERVAKLEAALCCDTPYRDQASELSKLRAQMVELREAWRKRGEPDRGMTDVRLTMWTPGYDTIDRILGGA